MGLRAGLLTESVVIEKPEINQDGYGANDLQWNQVVDTRAQVSYKSGTRRTENNEIVWTNEVVFTIRYYHQITENMRIVWQNRKYRILSIQRDREKNRQIIEGELINE